MLKNISIVLLFASILSCSHYKYKAETREEFNVYMVQWLTWKFKAFEDEIAAGKYKLFFSFKYDGDGFLTDCAIINNAVAKTIEREICESIGDIIYTEASGKTINYPITVVMEI